MRIKKDKKQIEKEKSIKIKNFKKEFKISKKEEEKLFKNFNHINGYIPKLNVLINDSNDYVVIVKCENFDSLLYLVDNLKKFNINLIQETAYKNAFYASICFIKTEDEKKDMKFLEMFIKELDARSDEFKILSLTEIFIFLRNYSHRKDDIKKNVINKIINNPLNSKLYFQNMLYPESVRFIDGKIIFNAPSKTNKDLISDKSIEKHMIFGLQMYPSYLYEGFLTEINHIKNVNTTTYISLVDKKKVLENIHQDTEQNNYIKKILETEEKLYNTCFYIHMFGNDEKLEKAIKIVEGLCKKYYVLINHLELQQKEAYESYIPLCSNKIKCKRVISDLSGIHPYNNQVIKNFENGYKYGKELISDSDFTYNRIDSGIILSSDRASKRNFISYEQGFIVSNKDKHFQKIDFLSTSNSLQKNTDFKYDFIESLIQDKETPTIKRLESSDLWLIFKIYLLLCLSKDKLNKQIDYNYKKDLLNTFDLLEEKEKTELISEIDKRKRVLEYLKKNYKKLYEKIMKTYNAPNDSIKEKIALIFNIIIQSYNKDEEKYIYIYNIQEIVECLDLLMTRIFNDRIIDKNRKTIYLLSSYNDYALYNDPFVSKIMFLAPYINIIDVQSNDLLMVNKYLDLSNDCIVHLSDRKNISGLLLTRTCEFNYYNEREVKENVI